MNSFRARKYPKITLALSLVPCINRIDQVPLPKAGTDDEQFEMLKTWLASYKPEELFDDTEGAKVVKPAVLKIVPDDPTNRLGQIRDAWPEYQPLNLPEDWTKFTQKAGEETSPMRASQSATISL